MKLTVPSLFLKIFQNKFKSNKAVNDALSYYSEGRMVNFHAEQFEDEELDELQRISKVNRSDKGGQVLFNKLGLYRNLKSNITGQKIGKLEALETALRGYIRKGPNKWVFSEGEDGNTVPYYVSDIAYTRPTRHERAHVTVSLDYVEFGKSQSGMIHFYVSDLRNRTVVEILTASGYYLETEAVVKVYKEAAEKHRQVSPLTGVQFQATGMGFNPNRHREFIRLTAMERDGVKAKLVIDDVFDEEKGGDRDISESAVTDAFWKRVTGDDGDGDEEESAEGEELVQLPVHPYVYAFDLMQHEFVKVHVVNLEPYVYDDTLVNKLVLPGDTKSVVNMLLHGASLILEDIVKGKTGGVIIVATGAPGTGKTLTAEVFSESIKRPLYVVNCSQLGTEEKVIEANLTGVLSRAQRWNALLLIDEADVYVHERGADIQQNAIVGVFLRVLEYYRGILFMTSNRATVIDDAILSRATAWLKYEFPAEKELVELWKILSAQYSVGLSPADIAELVKAFPTISGRNVKNMLKLARMLAAEQNKSVGPVQLKYVAKFLDINRKA